MERKIAFITYETPFAPCGGIAAVMARLPGYVQNAAGVQAIVITPYHYRIASTAACKQHTTEAGSVEVNGVKTKILRYAEWQHIGNLQNPTLFINRLRTKQTPFAGMLYERMPDDLQLRIEAFRGDIESGHDLAQAVTAQLNLLLHGEALSGNGLSDAKAGSDECLLHNYTLLQQAFPECLQPPRLWPWYFLEAGAKAGTPLFSGSPHPYSLQPEQLLHDALFFSAAAAKALPVLDAHAEWILLLQDWETAATALSLNGFGKQCKSFLVLHNSYDSKATDADLGGYIQTPAAFQGHSVLSRTIPLMQQPIFTVSAQFAADLTTDPLQVQVLADHLQGVLSCGITGVDNGSFGALHVPACTMQSALGGSFGELQEWKQEHRLRAITALKTFKVSAQMPVWGDPQKLQCCSSTSNCWFVLAGRDDPRQKGYDVAAAAVRRFLEDRGDACFFFFPLPGEEGMAGLSFLQRLAWEYPEQVIVFPFRWQEGYWATLRGASFGIMPSFYEPFGSANEFYLNGSAAIGRATGGLIQQIVPLQTVRSFSTAARIRAEKWHLPSAAPAGLLYRENDAISETGRDWQNIFRTPYKTGNGTDDRITQRMRFAVYREMVEELCLCLEDAVQIWKEQRGLYYKMVKEGILHIQNTFSWEQAADQYVQHFALMR